MKGHKHIVRTLIAVAKQREKMIIEHHRRELALFKLRVVLIASGTLLLVGAAGGIVLFVRTTKP